MENMGQYRAMIDAAVAAGGEPGLPDGPLWARGCDNCRFGIAHQPDLVHCGVPLWIARAMAINIDGICYVVYCNCRAGQMAQQHDQRSRERMDAELKNIVVVDKVDDQGRRVRGWGNEAPPDYISGSSWQAVRDACEASHF